MDSIIFSIITSPHWINEPRNRIRDSVVEFWAMFWGMRRRVLCSILPQPHKLWLWAVWVSPVTFAFFRLKKNQEIVVVSVSVISRSHNHSKSYLLKKTVVVPRGQECGDRSESFMKFQSDVSWGLQHLKVSRGPKVSLPRWLTHAAGKLVPLHAGLSAALNVSVFMKQQLASPRASNPRDQDGNRSYFTPTFGSHTHHVCHILLVGWGSP